MQRSIGRCIFMGILCWLSGIINFGIFPAVGSRFFVYFCGFPRYIVNLGPLELDITLGIVVFVILGFALLFTFWGGQIAVMITDFCQGQFFNITFLIILILLPTIL